MPENKEIFKKSLHQNFFKLCENVTSLRSHNSEATTENWKKREEIWNVLNAVMNINNRKRIDALSNTLQTERARIRYVEDRNDQLEERLTGLDENLQSAHEKLACYKQGLKTTIALLRIISVKATAKNSASFTVGTMLKTLNVSDILKSVAKHAALVGLIQLLCQTFWVDAAINSFVGVLKLLKLSSNRALGRTRLAMKLSVTMFLFVLLRKRFQELLNGCRNVFKFLTFK